MDGPDLHDYLKFVFALIFVLSLMGGLALLVKKLGLGGNLANIPTKKRLRIVDVLPLDARRRAVLIKRDETEHLVILGPNSETVVETGINVPASRDAIQSD